MNASSIDVRGSWVHRYLVPPNPFYCLSAMCMMVGCYLTADALAARPGAVGELLVLMATLQVYEFLLVGLGVYLVRRATSSKNSGGGGASGGGRIEDGWLLLIIEAVFIVDAAHLNVEAVGIDATLGGLLTAATLGLAAIKLAVVIRFLRLRPAVSQLVFVGLGLLLVLAMPAVIAAWFEANAVNTWVIYGCWWLLGVVVALHGFWPRWREADRAAALARRITMGLAAALYLSAGLHVIALAWVHSVDTEFAFASPVLASLLPWIGRIGERLRWRDATITAWQAALPAVAIVLSVPGAERMTVVFDAALGLPYELGVSPFRLVLMLATLVYIALAIDGRHAWAAMAAALCATAMMVGPSPSAIAETGQLGVGVLVVWLAFVLLAVGAWSSFKPLGRTRDPMPEPIAPPPQPPGVTD